MTTPGADIRLRIVGIEDGKLRFHVGLDDAAPRLLFSGVVDPEDPEEVARRIEDIRACVPDAEPVLDDLEQALTDPRAREQILGAWAPPTPFGSASVEPPELPLEAAIPRGLSDLRDFVSAVATEAQVPVEFVVFLMLPVGAICGARKFELWPGKGNWREVCGLYVLVLMESGTRKSPVARQLLEPIVDWQRAMRSQQAPELRAYEDEAATRDQRRKQLQRQAARSGPEGETARAELAALAHEDEPRRPVGHDLIVSDTTSEALADHLAENGERALVASTEADVLDIVLGRYNEGRANLGLLCKAYTGEAETIRRKSRPLLHLENPVLNVALAVQPEGAREALANKTARGRGLWARFLKVAPPCHVGQRLLDPPAVPTELRDTYAHRLQGVLDIPLPERPHCIRLEPEARKTLDGHRAALERRLGEGGDLAPCREWASKLTGNLLRIALVFHVLEHGADAANRKLSTETMRAALAWEGHLVASEEHVEAIAGIDEDVALAQKLVATLAKEGKPEISQRDLFAKNRTRTRDSMQSFQRAFRLLEDHGYARSIQVAPSRGGRPSDRFLVNPYLLERLESAP